MEIQVWHSEEEIWVQAQFDPYPRIQGLEAVGIKMELHKIKNTIKKEEHLYQA